MSDLMTALLKAWWYWRINLVATIVSCLVYALESNPAYVFRPLPSESHSKIIALCATLSSSLLLPL